MDVRERMLDAAEAQLDASPRRDVAVRAVCEAVGVGAPVLYRVFGDKNGLLEAVVDRSFERYLRTKRDATVSEDPVSDLRAGWDAHLAFATAHPAVYRLAHSPAFATPPAAVGRSLDLLRQILERCARAGRLRVPPAVAARTVMAANVGVCLSKVTQPALYDDPGLSHRVRDAVFAAVLTPDAPAVDGGRDLRWTAAGDAEELRRRAVSIGAQLRGAPSQVLTAEEVALLQQWLARLSATG